ncbi:hypothetical protein KKA15_01375 [Patescibacteria group bacterium]|nr:hypothetical protein [Patescibacteria group bacterium]
MKKRIISFLALAVIMFCLSMSAVYANDCDCDENGPNYRNHAVEQPNKS